MTISSSLNASVAGLQANASQLSSISDNIANSSTYGYKRATTDFHSMVNASGSMNTYAAGGVSVTTQKLIDERGPLITTTNPTDLAISGVGFLPVVSTAAVDAGSNDLTLQLTTTGSFRVNENGLLETTSGQTLLGWPASPDGTVPDFARDAMSGLEPVEIQLGHIAGEATTGIDLRVNLPATSTLAGASGTAESLAIDYYDNLGMTESLTVTFTPTVPAAAASNEWTMTIADSASAGAIVGEYVLTFDDDRDTAGTLLSVTSVTGGAYDAATGMVGITVAGGDFLVEIGQLGATTGMSQLSDAYSPGNVTKNGFPAGILTTVEVDEGGLLYGVYDSGLAKLLYQVPLVNVANPNGLMSMGNDTYGISLQSGGYYLWDAGDGPTGTIESYAREESATDVATELTNLIETQRAYSSNAKVIQTVALSLAEPTALPVDMIDWVSAMLELIALRVCSATMAPLFVRMLDIRPVLPF